MMTIANLRVHHALVFVGSVLLGLCLRGEQVAHAGKDCAVGTNGELLEVRRVEGTGDIAVEEMSWQADLWLEAGGSPSDAITLSSKTPPFEYESFLIELEEGP